MALENIEENQEKVNAAALSVLEDGAKNKITKEVVDEQEVTTTKDGKFSIDIMGALSNVGSSATAFVQDVGSNLSAIAEAVPAKIEEISQDPKKKKNFMRGLEIINASSGIKPISQAKSPFGAVAEGLLKAEKGFIAVDLAKLKANKDERRYKSGKETALEKLYTTYASDFEKSRKDYTSVDTRFNEIYKLAQGGKVPPTGILESSFSGLEKVLDEVGLLDRANKLIGRNKDNKVFSNEDLIEFKEIFTAATKRQIVGQGKRIISCIKQRYRNITSNSWRYKYKSSSFKSISCC